MEITKKDVEYISELARLKLTEEEKDIYQGQLKNILDWMEELNNADTSKVLPTAHVLGIKNVFRPDEPEKFKNRDAILDNAPERELDFFKVKKVIE
ncbi:MAG: Asp-tRNA(Asn)/Glu-tRNA(Gln) amidotransferase subunit GatC [Elusimicrobiota bacterium]